MRYHDDTATDNDGMSHDGNAAGGSEHPTPMLLRALARMFQ
jgi:hypothetical protein